MIEGYERYDDEVLAYTEADLAEAVADAEERGRKQLIRELSDKVKALPTSERLAEAIISDHETMTDAVGLVGKVEADVDTVLRDIMAQQDVLDFDEPGIGINLVRLYRDSADKAALAEMFYELTGTDFSTFLGRAAKEEHDNVEALGKSARWKTEKAATPNRMRDAPNRDKSI